MIVYPESAEDLRYHIHNDIAEIGNITTVYQTRLELFEKHLIALEEGIQKQEKAEDVDRLLEFLHAAEDSLSNVRRQIGHSIKGEQVTLRYLEKFLYHEAEANGGSQEAAEMEDNDTLFISEAQNKVILPYKASEVQELLTSDANDYADIQTVIAERYTIPLTHYKHAGISRFRETFLLMREKEKASLLDSLDLALELMPKRYVHPAIITACKDSDQLDIYLDCLETNELEDFPFFQIRYELVT